VGLRIGAVGSLPRRDVAGRLVKEQSGQSIVIVVAALVVLLGFCGLVMDIGRAYYVQRSLQSSVDAAALAGAAQLPDPTKATAVARQYGATSGGANYNSRLPAVAESVTAVCNSSVPGCQPDNQLTVSDSVQSPTSFLKLFGLHNFTIKVKATARLAGSTPKPAHILIIFDRTGSMNDPCDAGGTKVTCVRDGIKAFLQGMDPAYDKVGLIAFPPGNGGNPCTFTPKDTDGPTTDYDAYPNGYLVVPLSTNYKTSATSPLNTSSQLVSTVNCIKAAGTTATAPAIDYAEKTLQASHDPNAQDVIIFLTDGEANYGPCQSPNRSGVCSNNTSPYRSTPCHQAVSSAQAATAAGTSVYAIAYDTGSVQCWGWRSTGTGTDGKSCNKTNGYQFRCLEQPTITALTMVQGIASEPSKFYNQPNASDLTTVFQQIAATLSGPELVDDDTG